MGEFFITVPKFVEIEENSTIYTAYVVNVKVRKMCMY